MSEWNKAKGEVKRKARIMEKIISNYSYQDPKHSSATDKQVRITYGDDVNKARDLLFPLIESSYLENNMDNAGALEDVMQWLDVFLLELGLPLIWKLEANYRDYSRLIKYDVEMLENTRKLLKAFEKLNTEGKKGEGKSFVKKSAQLKKSIQDLLSVFKRRRHVLGG